MIGNKTWTSSGRDLLTAAEHNSTDTSRDQINYYKVCVILGGLVCQRLESGSERFIYTHKVLLPSVCINIMDVHHVLALPWFYVLHPFECGMELRDPCESSTVIKIKPRCSPRKGAKVTGRETGRGLIIQIRDASTHTHMQTYIHKCMSALGEWGRKRERWRERLFKIFSCLILKKKKRKTFHLVFKTCIYVVVIVNHRIPHTL